MIGLPFGSSANADRLAEAEDAALQSCAPVAPAYLTTVMPPVVSPATNTSPDASVRTCHGE